MDSPSSFDMVVFLSMMDQPVSFILTHAMFLHFSKLFPHEFSWLFSPGQSSQWNWQFITGLDDRFVQKGEADQGSFNSITKEIADTAHIHTTTAHFQSSTLRNYPTFLSFSIPISIFFSFSPKSLRHLHRYFALNVRNPHVNSTSFQTSFPFILSSDEGKVG